MNDRLLKVYAATHGGSINQAREAITKIIIEASHELAPNFLMEFNEPDDCVQDASVFVLELLQGYDPMNDEDLFSWLINAAVERFADE